jgi:hypothetical protein
MIRSTKEDERPSEPLGSADASREVLFQKWLAHFNVIDPRELDLGVLMTIGELARDGLSPPSGPEE